MGKKVVLSSIPVVTKDGTCMRMQTPEVYPRRLSNLTRNSPVEVSQTSLSTTKYLVPPTPKYRSASLPKNSLNWRSSCELLTLPFSSLSDTQYSCSVPRVRSFYRDRNRIFDDQIIVNVGLTPKSAYFMSAIPCGHFDVAVVGRDCTGKSDLVQQFVASDLYSKKDRKSESDVSVLLDGQRTSVTFTEYSDITGSCNGSADPISADGYVVMYSVTDRVSFNDAVSILFVLKSRGIMKTKPVILVANKCDIVRQRKVTCEESVSVAKQYGCKHLEISVIIGHKIDELLVGLVIQLRKQLSCETSKGDRESKKSPPSGRKNSAVKWFFNIAKQKLVHSRDVNVTLSIYDDVSL